MDPNEHNKTFKETSIRYSDKDDAIAPLDPIIVNPTEAAPAKETQIHSINVMSHTESPDADVENGYGFNSESIEVEENDTELIANQFQVEGFQNQFESESEGNNEGTEIGENGYGFNSENMEEDNTLPFNDNQFQENGYDSHADNREEENDTPFSDNPFQEEDFQDERESESEIKEGIDPVNSLPGSTTDALADESGPITDVSSTQDDSRQTPQPCDLDKSNNENEIQINKSDSTSDNFEEESDTISFSEDSTDSEDLESSYSQDETNRYGNRTTMNTEIEDEQKETLNNMDETERIHYETDISQIAVDQEATSHLILGTNSEGRNNQMEMQEESGTLGHGDSASCSGDDQDEPDNESNDLPEENDPDGTYRSLSQVKIEKNNDLKRSQTGLRPFFEKQTNTDNDLEMVIVKKQPNNIIWLIGSDENTTFNHACGRRLIENIFEIAVDSDSLLIVHGTPKFAEEVEDQYRHSELMAKNQRIMGYIAQDIFIKNDFQAFEDKEEPIFQCAFVFEIHDHVYTQAVEGYLKSVPVIIVQEKPSESTSNPVSPQRNNHQEKQDKEINDTPASNSLLPANLDEKGLFHNQSLPPANQVEKGLLHNKRNPTKNTRLDWDLQQSIENETIDKSRVVRQIITAFKEHNKLTKQTTDEMSSKLILLCISLNYIDKEIETIVKEKKDRQKNFEREAMLSISLHRQHFLTLFCKNGMDLKELLNDRFMLKLYSKEKWNKYAKDEQKAKLKENADTGFKTHTNVGDEHENEAKLINIAENKKKEAEFRMRTIESYLKSMIESKIGSIKFGTESKDPLEKPELLFITSILQSKLELSLVFWTNVRHPIAAALIAYGIFKAMKSSGNKEDKMLKENMVIYRKLSIEAIFKAFITDKKSTFEILSQKIPEWGNLSCTDIALVTGNKKFLSKIPTIELRSHIWSGKPLSSNTFTAESVSKESSGGIFITPIRLWWLSFFCYIVLLGIYSVLLVTSLETSPFHWLEWVLLALVAIYSLFTLMLLFKRGLGWIKNIFNVLKTVSLLVFFIAWIFRLFGYFETDIPELMKVARVLYSASFIVWCIGFLKYFYYSKYFGPIVAMIFEMISTLGKFIGVILVFIVAYSVASESVLYPNAEINVKLPFFVFRKSFWSIFGQLFLEELEATEGSCTHDPALYNNYTETRCPSEEGRYWVPLILGAYVLVVNILIINLLIAKFNSIIIYVEIRALQIWHYKNFQVAMEYREMKDLIFCRNCIKKSDDSDVKPNTEQFEKVVVKYLKQQIDDGRFFERLEAYKKTKAKSMHGIFSSLKEITDSLSTHGQLLQTFITDVNESIHGRNVEFDATTEGVMQEIKKSNETTSNLIDMFNKLQLQHEETAKEMKKGYERTLQLERRVKRGKENSKKIKYELEKRKNAVRKKNKEINQIKIQGEMSKSKLQELQKQLETQRRMQSNKKLAFNKMQADLDKKQEILSQNIKNYCDDLKQQNTEANITLTNLLTNVKAEWLNEIKQLNTVTRQGLSDDLQTLKDTIVNSAVDKKLIQDIDVTTKKIIRPQPKFPEAGGNK